MDRGKAAIVCLITLFILLIILLVMSFMYNPNPELNVFPVMSGVVLDKQYDGHSNVYLFMIKLDSDGKMHQTLVDIDTYYLVSVGDTVRYKCAVVGSGGNSQDKMCNFIDWNK